jgi:hypothetical protein
VQAQRRSRGIHLLILDVGTRCGESDTIWKKEKDGQMKTDKEHRMREMQ